MAAHEHDHTDDDCHEGVVGDADFGSKCKTAVKQYALTTMVAKIEKKSKKELKNAN